MRCFVSIGCRLLLLSDLSDYISGATVKTIVALIIVDQMEDFDRKLGVPSPKPTRNDD